MEAASFPSKIPRHQTQFPILIRAKRVGVDRIFAPRHRRQSCAPSRCGKKAGGERLYRRRVGTTGRREEGGKIEKSRATKSKAKRPTQRAGGKSPRITPTRRATPIKIRQSAHAPMQTREKSLFPFPFPIPLPPKRPGPPSFSPPPQPPLPVLFFAFAVYCLQSSLFSLSPFRLYSLCSMAFSPFPSLFVLLVFPIVRFIDEETLRSQRWLLTLFYFFNFFFTAWNLRSFEFYPERLSLIFIALYPPFSICVLFPETLCQFQDCNSIFYVHANFFTNIHECNNFGQSIQHINLDEHLVNRVSAHREKART